MTEPDLESAARAAYEAFYAYRNGRTRKGKPLARWNSLTSDSRYAWRAAAVAAASSAASDLLRREHTETMLPPAPVLDVPLQLAEEERTG